MRRTALMHNGAHGTHRIALMGRRYMIAAYLHADNIFVGITYYHRAKPCHCLCQRKRGSAMQDAERLTVAVVNGHSGLNAVVRGIGVLYAEVAHKRRLRLGIEFIERNLARTHLCQERLLNNNTARTVFNSFFSRMISAASLVFT